MSIMRCDQCDKPFDTDQVDMERFPCGEDDSFNACPTCAEKIYADQEYEMQAAYAEYVVASPEQRNPDQYRADMIAAGRGHLLRD